LLRKFAVVPDKVLQAAKSRSADQIAAVEAVGKSDE
jgi:hypothetical protein